MFIGGPGIVPFQPYTASPISQKVLCTLAEDGSACVADVLERTLTPGGRVKAMKMISNRTSGNRRSCLTNLWIGIKAAAECMRLLRHKKSSDRLCFKSSGQ